MRVKRVYEVTVHDTEWHVWFVTERAERVSRSLVKSGLAEDRLVGERLARNAIKIHKQDRAEAAVHDRQTRPLTFTVDG